MNLLRLLPGYRRMEAALCVAEQELSKYRLYYEQEVTRYAEARAFDAQTVEMMRAAAREEVGRLVELLDKERTDRQWATDRLLESCNVRPIHEPSPRERAETEAKNDSVPRETLGPRARAVEAASSRRAEVSASVERQVNEFKTRMAAEQAEQERKAEEAKNGAGV